MCNVLWLDARGAGLIQPGWTRTARAQCAINLVSFLKQRHVICLVVGRARRAPNSARLDARGARPVYNPFGFIPQKQTCEVSCGWTRAARDQFSQVGRARARAQCTINLVPCFKKQTCDMSCGWTFEKGLFLLSDKMTHVIVCC